MATTSKAPQQQIEVQTTRFGIAPNELTCVKARDPISGTPWHKYVPAAITKTA